MHGTQLSVGCGTHTGVHNGHIVVCSVHNYVRSEVAVNANAVRVVQGKVTMHVTQFVIVRAFIDLGGAV